MKSKISKPNTVNLHEAKTHLSQLLNQVEAGSEVIIAKSGRPIAKLTPFTQQDGARERELGSAKDLIWISPDFDEEDETLLKLFGA